MPAGELRTFIRNLRRSIDPDGRGRTDSQLVERFLRQRDDAAFEVLVWRHGPMVLDVCQRLLSNPCDVEDAFQAAFLALARKAGSIGRREAVGGWLYRVAYRVALRARMQSAQRARHERPGRDLVAALAPSNPVWCDLRAVLDEEINRLPVRYRAPIVLCCLEGKTNKEAAGQLGCPPGTVFSRLTRARARLRLRLMQRGVTLTVGALGALVTRNASTNIPASLVDATTTAATCFAAGTAAQAGVISAGAAVLAEGVLRTMLLTRVTTAATVVLLVSLVGLGGGLLRSTQAAGVILSNQPTALESPRADKEHDRERTGWTERFRQDVDTGDVLTVAFAPDGRTLAAGDMKGTVRHWETRTGRELRSFQALKGYIEAVVFSPDGKTLVAAGGEDVEKPGTISLWDVASGHERTRQLDGLGERWVGHRDMVSSAAFSPDGRVLATGSIDHTVILWEVATGRMRALLSGHGRPVFAVSFSPDGKTLASAGGEVVVKRNPTAGELMLWDATTGKTLRSIQAPEGTLTSVAYSPDGKRLLTGCYDRSAKLWDVASGRIVRVLHGHEGLVRSVAFGPDSRTVATGSLDETVKLWDLVTGRELATLGSNRGTISAVAFSPDGALLAAANAVTRFTSAEKG
jgi:RNA polymerase sigma factor (sigma-70 family)